MVHLPSGIKLNVMLRILVIQHTYLLPNLAISILQTNFTNLCTVGHKQLVTIYKIIPTDFRQTLEGDISEERNIEELQQISFRIQRGEYITIIMYDGTMINLPRDLTRLQAKEYLRWQWTRKPLAYRESKCTILSVTRSYKILVYSVLEHVTVRDISRWMQTVHCQH